MATVLHAVAVHNSCINHSTGELNTSLVNALSPEEASLLPVLDDKELRKSLWQCDDLPKGEARRFHVHCRGGDAGHCQSQKLIHNITAEKSTRGFLGERTISDDVMSASLCRSCYFKVYEEEPRAPQGEQAAVAW